MNLTKRKIFILVLALLSGLALFVFTRHDAFMYQQPVGKVEQARLLSTRTTKDTFNNRDRQTRKELTLRILNGKYKGKTVKLINTYSASGGLDQKFGPNQQVFLTLTKKNGQLQGQIQNYKRDTYLLMLVWLTVVLLLLTLQFQGLWVLFSVALNFVLFLIFIQLDVQLNLTYFFWLFALSALLFTGLSLLLVIGWNKQCGVIFTAVTVGTVLGLAVGYLCLMATGSRGVHYEALDFATQSPEQLFFSATVIGLLGAVMDAATDIVSTVFELKRTEPQIGRQKLFKSGQQVGKAIMGPLINVLLMIFFADTIVMAVLFLRTGNSIAYTFEWTMALGVVQSLISGIGIVLVIPTASALSALVLGRDKQ